MYTKEYSRIDGFEMISVNISILFSSTGKTLWLMDLIIMTGENVQTNLVIIISDG
jgi:hypothetical protein